MDPKTYLDLKGFIIRSGYIDEILYYEDGGTPAPDAKDFALEVIFVICNSGVKAQIARKIFNRVKIRLVCNREIGDAYKHPGKVAAIRKIWGHRKWYFLHYNACMTDLEKLCFFETIPFIGKITKYHLSKNLGIDVIKPDRHLVRIAKTYNTDPETLCKNLSETTGDKVSVIDYVIWRAANLGKI